MHKISFIVVQNSSTHIPETIASIKSSPPNNMVQLFCPKKSVLLQLILMLPIIISAVKKSPRFLLNSPFYKLSPNKPPSLSIIFPDGYKGGDFALWILELTNESQGSNHIVRNSMWLKKNQASEIEGKFHTNLKCRMWIHDKKIIS